VAMKHAIKKQIEMKTLLLAKKAVKRKIQDLIEASIYFDLLSLTK